MGQLDLVSKPWVCGLLSEFWTFLNSYRFLAFFGGGKGLYWTEISSVCIFGHGFARVN